VTTPLSTPVGSGFSPLRPAHGVEGWEGLSQGWAGRVEPEFLLATGPCEVENYFTLCGA